MQGNMYVRTRMCTNKKGMHRVLNSKLDYVRGGTDYNVMSQLHVYVPVHVYVRVPWCQW
jgi:hypothetical protein